MKVAKKVSVGVTSTKNKLCAKGHQNRFRNGREKGLQTNRDFCIYIRRDRFRFRDVFRFFFSLSNNNNKKKLKPLFI